MTTRVWLGLSHVLTGAQLILKEKSIRKWALIPFLIDICLVFIGVSIGIGLISGWVASALAFLGLGGTGFLSGTVSFLFSALLWVGYIIVILYGTFLISTVIAAPFNSLLAEQTLMYLGAIERQPFQLKKWLSTSVKMLFLGLIKSALFAFFGIFIFIGSFIPIVNVFSSICALLIMSFDSMDYSFEVYELGLRQRLRFFQEHFAEFFGMAGGLAFTLFVPGLTVVLLPCSVVGAALVISQKKKLGDSFGTRRNS
ncbi:MAG: EI24 domain-containing protein [Bdellovibrionales bacterium]|nr:EI24 domain-containing protein [Bdellovibrionales bacterium]